MAPPLDNCYVTGLVIRYQHSSEASEREKLFAEIVDSVLPLIESTIYRHRRDLTLAESAEDLRNEIVARLPRILSGWCPSRGSSFASYFLSCVFNDFRHRYAKRQRRSRYHADWPRDENGDEADIADGSTKMLNGHQTTLEARGREFEQLMFRIPSQLAAQVGPEYGGLVHYVAERILTRADNTEPLFLSELERELSRFPAAAVFSTREELDSFVRMILVAVRARLYALRQSDSDDFGSAKGFLVRFSPKLWPLLLLCDSPAETAKLVASLAGICAGIPPRQKWYRAS